MDALPGFLSGRTSTCILLWILYGNVVDFSFIVSLYVSDLPNVTKVPYESCSTSTHAVLAVGFTQLNVNNKYEYEYERFTLGKSETYNTLTIREFFCLYIGQIGNVQYTYDTRTFFVKKFG